VSSSEFDIPYVKDFMSWSTKTKQPSQSSILVDDMRSMLKNIFGCDLMNLNIGEENLNSFEELDTTSTEGSNIGQDGLSLGAQSNAQNSCLLPGVNVDKYQKLIHECDEEVYKD